MSMHDRLFWGFVLTFYAGAMILGVYLQEAGIAAIFGWLFGQSFELFNSVRKKQRIR